MAHKNSFEKVNPSNDLDDIDRTGHVYGNFNNYYQFHSADSRMKQFPSGCFVQLWKSMNRPHVLHLLDIGCNDGSLSYLLLQHVTCEINNYLADNEEETTKCVRCVMLGIDIDPYLIERANQTYGASRDVASTIETDGNPIIETGLDAGAPHSTPCNVHHSPHPDSSISFETIDFMSDYKKGKASGELEINAPHQVALQAYLKKHEVSHFHFISLFSILMWMHINCGDVSLNYIYAQLVYLVKPSSCSLDDENMKECSILCGSILIEPQPWKCYKTAKKRLQRNHLPIPTAYDSIEIKDTIPHVITYFKKLCISNAWKCMYWGFGEEECWGRSMLCFHIYNQSSLMNNCNSNLEEFYSYGIDNKIECEMIDANISILETSKSNDTNIGFRSRREVRDEKRKKKLESSNCKCSKNMNEFENVNIHNAADQSRSSEKHMEDKCGDGEVQPLGKKSKIC